MMTSARVLMRLASGSVFIVSGFTKLMSPPENFAFVVESYQLFPRSLVTLIAWVVPWAEYLGGLYLMLGLHARQAMKLLWIMDTVFVIVVTQALLRRIDIVHCGCFGESLPLSLGQILGVDLVLWFVFAWLRQGYRDIERWGLDSLRLPGSSNPGKV